MPANSSPPRAAMMLVVFIAITFCAAGVGAFAMPGAWYASIQKPSWNPPAWIFGPAWTLLYTLMAVAAWMVWKRGGFAAQKGPLTLYFIQLALNAAWSPIFFGAHAMGWALVEIVVLWVAILSTMMSFFSVSKGAGGLLVPYLAWVSFATFLNFTLWRLNAG